MINENTKLLAEKIDINSEESQSIEEIQRKDNPSLQKKITPLLALSISALVALPTSVLCGLSAIEGSSGNLGHLDSLTDIEHLLSNESIETLVYGAVSFLASEIVLAHLNKKYLLGSTRTVLDLLKRDLVYIKSKFTQQINNPQRPSIIENSLFIWCFMTSLIFAEIGKETLSFLGEPGKIVGFYLNLVVYFATRFAGARSFFQKIIEHTDIQAMKIEQSTNKQELMRKIIPASGYLLALVSSIPVIINFIPESVQGLQSLFHSDLAADKKYQNLAAISLGIIGTLPTVFFYSVSIKALPNHISNTVSSIRKKIQTRNVKDVSILIGLTLLAFWASYFTSIGFRLVGTTNVESGYLSYLSKSIENIMPEALFACVTMMFWSHLQHLVNDNSAEPVISQPKIRVSNNRYSLLANPRKNALAIYDMQNEEPKGPETKPR